MELSIWNLYPTSVARMKPFLCSCEIGEKISLMVGRGVGGFVTMYLRMYTDIDECFTGVIKHGQTMMALLHVATLTTVQGELPKYEIEPFLLQSLYLLLHWRLNGERGS